MRRTIVMTLIAAAAVGGFVFAFSAPRQEASGLPPAVERVSPADGDLNLRQETISADLVPGYTGYLLINGVEVPRDDLQVVDAINTITLRPLPDSDYAVLEPGPYCATIVYRPIGRPESDSESYTWCFRLH